MKRIISSVVVALAMLAVAGPPALADPVKLQPSTEKTVTAPSSLALLRETPRALVT